MHRELVGALEQALARGTIEGASFELPLRWIERALSRIAVDAVLGAVPASG